MMKRFTPALLASLLVAGLSCSLFSYAESIQTLNISQIRPTQPAIGDDEVAIQVAKLQANPKALFNDFCRDSGARGVKFFDRHSSLAQPTSFSCLAAIGSEPSEIKSAVIAPDHHIYLTDGHHTVSTYRTLADNQDFPFTVRITDDFSQLPSMDDFWTTMRQRHLTWLNDPQGNPVRPAQLPLQVSTTAMQNDPYRSIVFLLRGVAYDKPDQAPPFLEFYLGRWLRTQLPITSQPFTNKAAYMAYLHDAATKLVAAKGDEPATDNANSPTLAQLGKRQTVNKKKLARLAEPGGKLSLLFKE